MPRDDDKALRLFLKKGVALMKKRGLSLFLALALCLSLLPATAWAEGTDTTVSTWDGTSVNTEWYDSENPQDTYTITTAEQLAGLASKVNGGTSFSGVTITLGADIVLNTDGSTTNNWTPIGNSSTKSFQGTFDGQSHTVSGLYVSISKNYTNTYAGLFGRVIGGTVKNLAVSGEVTAEVTASGNNPAYAGGVVGYHYGGNVENCSFSGNVSASVNMTTSSSTLNNAYAGGVVGYANSGTTVKNCYHTGTVTATATGSGATAYAGGVTGLSYATATNCYHTGTVTASGGRDGYAGGVAGKSSGTVSNCYFLQEEGGTLSGIGYNASASGAESKTAAAFASGEVAWLLNGNADSGLWYQNLTGDDADGSPVLDSTHAQVMKLGTAYLNPLELGADGVYEISTAAELAWFANEVNGGKTTISGRLVDDINLSSVCGETLGSWTPIGNGGFDSQSFRGTFDGQGHTVSGLYVSISKTDESVYGGLFGRVSGGTVKNLAVSGEVTAKVTSPRTSCSPCAGGVAGYNNGGNVENCSFSGNVSASVSGGSSMVTSSAGGVAGYNSGGNVENCYHTGTVTATAAGNNPYFAYAGGVAGSNSGTVTNCYHTGGVTASGSKNNYAGGVVGKNNGSMTNCYFLQEEGSSLSGIDSNSGTAENVEGKDTAAFASGEVAWLLQGSQADTVWVQNLAENGDKYPVLAAFLADEEEVAAKTVYQVTFTASGTTNSTYYQNTGSPVTIPTVPDGYSGWYTDGNQEFTSATMVTADLVLTAKTKEIADIEIDYENETLTGFDSGATYTIDGKEVTPNDSTLPVAAYMGQTVSIVRKSTGDTYSVDSDPQELTIPARPAAPTGVQGQNETVDGNHDGKITGVTTAMEYKLSTAESWTKCTGTEVTGLEPGSYQIRLAATDAAFASAAADVTIATGAARTYTLNVTAPTFDSAAYGYAQPDAKAITISNSGNSASAISGVALSGDTSAFTLNKADGATVQPGQSDTSYTIQPAAGLGAGTYTATIAVTYQDSETATATVSFTVAQAAQEAPADAPQLASRTTTSITLKEVAENTNGAAAEYGISTDGGKTWTWQASPAFTKLSSGKEYTFAVRYGATTDGNYAASPASVTAAFSTTWPSSPAPTYTTTVEDADNGTVSVTPASPKQGGTVTITPTPDKGYETASVTVTDSKGNPVTVTDNGDGTYSFTQPASKVTISVTYACDGRTDNCPSYHFGDVDTTKWYHAAVDYMVTHGLMTGTAPDIFSPNSTTTRAMVVTILYRLEGEPSTSGSTAFTDVERGAWYTDPIAWAAANGVVDGTSPTTFAPNSPVTREQMATILYRYLAAKGYDVTARADLSAYTDADQISSYATDAMSWANALGLITGETPTTLVPQGNATRAQVATILMRFCEIVAQP